MTIKGGKGQRSGFIEADQFTAIETYESEELGKQATARMEKITYAYVTGDDLIIKTNHFTSFVVYTASPSSVETAIDLKKLYSDAETISVWAYDAIGNATQKGFIQGGNGKLNPQSAITRAEFTKLLVSVLGINAATSKTSGFKDVSPDEWYYPYVNAAYQADLIRGYDNRFNPNDIITREQMAVILSKALAVQPAELAVAVADLDKVSMWAKSEVQTIVSLKLMLGDNNRFDPKGSATREMAAVVAMRAFDFKNESKIQENQTTESNQQAVKKQIKATAAYMQKTITNPAVASIGGEWTVLGLARSGIQIPDSYYASYYANLEKTLKEKSGSLHSVKYTEYDRVILALTSIGKGIENVAGYKLTEKLADFDTLIKQGINGPIFALIALDSKKYEIPLVQGVKTQTTREMLVDFILKREISGGGWALGETPSEPDSDVTAMAIQGLAPYYNSNNQVHAAVDRAVAWLSQVQQADGGFVSLQASNSESVAQVIVALSSLNINSQGDSRFVKNGHSAVDALLSFAANDGGFYHIKSGGADNGGAKPGAVDPMATDQAMYALVAYDRYINGQTRLYDMTDVK